MKTVLFFVFFFNAEEYDPEKDVKDMIAAYNKMNPVTDDVMETLRAMRDHGDEYFEKMARVTGLVFADVKPNTKEYYAKKELQKHYQRTMFADRNELLAKRKPEPLQSYAEMNETYNKKVKNPLQKIRKLMKKVNENNGKVSEKEIEEVCDDENSPSEMLKHLFAILFDQCQISNNETEKEAVNFALSIAFFHSLSHDMNLERESEYTSLKKKFLSFITRMDQEQADHSLKSLDESIQNDGRNVVNKLRDNVNQDVDGKWFVKRMRESKNFNCYPREIVQNFDYHFKPPFEEMKPILKDVDDTASAATFCIKQARYPNETERTELLAEIPGKVTSIKNFTNDYLKKKLDSAWGGEILLEIAKREFGISDLDKINDWYSRAEHLAREIRKALDIRGNDSYSHQVVIGDPWTTSQNSYTLCVPQNCFKIVDYHGTNIYVFRFHKNSAKRAANAKEWFNGIQSKILDVLSQNYKVDDLGILSDRLYDNLKTNLIDSDRDSTML